MFHILICNIYLFKINLSHSYIDIIYICAFSGFFFITFDILQEIEWRVTRSAELRLRTAR